MKRNTMNLFELYDYIEALEKRIEALENLITVIEINQKNRFDNRLSSKKKKR
jgi:hypothetical protein